MGEVRQLIIGERLFVDRTYTLASLPTVLTDKAFVFSNIGSTKAICREPGVVYVLSPRPIRNARGSCESVLLRRGFAKAAVAEFTLFGGAANICSVYQKHVKAGEHVEFGLWGVLVF